MRRLLPFLVIAFFTLSAPAARAEGISLRVLLNRCKMSREECARKAVEVMGVQEKLLFVEVTADGNAQGWNDKLVVQVLSYLMPDPEAVYIVVIAAGANEKDVALVSRAVASHVSDGPDNPKTPKRISAADGKVPSRPFTLTCKSVEVADTPVMMRHFAAVASLELEKKGAQTKVGEKHQLAMGLFEDRSVAAFPAPTALAHLDRLNVVCVTSGEQSGEKFASDLLARIVKVIYE